MTLREITAKRKELDNEYDALTEKIQAKRAELVDVHGYSLRDAGNMMSTACRKEFDRQTVIENEIAELDKLAQPMLDEPALMK